MEPNKIFHEWVDEKLHLFLLVLLLAAISLSNGVVGNGSAYMVGSLSAIPADIGMASYSYAIGLVCGIPLVLSLKQFYSSKVILMTVFSSLVIVNIVLGYTDQPLILVMASFVNGFIKIIGLLEILATLIPILMPKGERHKLYGVYYPVSLITAQVTAIAFVWMANTYNWQISQLFLNVPLLLALLIVIFLVHPKFPGKQVSLVNFDWFGLVIAVIFMLLLNYVLTYGQVNDWFASRQISIGTIFCLLSLLLLLARTFVLRKAFLDLSVFRYNNVIFGLSVMMILCIFYGAGNLQTAMISIAVKNDPVETTRISLYLIPGYIVAGIIGVLYYNRYHDFKLIIIVVVLCYTVSYYQFYQLTTLQATSGDFYFPMFLRGVASLLSFMATGIYVANGVPFLEFFSVVFYYLTTRSFLGPVIFSSFFSNFYYHRTIHDLSLLASKADLANTYQQERFKPLFNSAIKAGLSSNDAVNTSIKGMYGTLQTQASLLALRESFGLIIIVGILLIGALIISKIFWPDEPKHATGFVVP
jgi:MFS transporter, DHA2 family, multidrug resistance protein